MTATTTKEAPIQPAVVLEPAVVEPKTYFGVQVLKGENFKAVAKVVVWAAHAANVLFRDLNVLDVITVGTTSYLRFSADLSMESLSKVASQFGRGSILPNFGGTYVATLPNGRTGKVSGVAMLMVSKFGQKLTYRGTKIKRWEEQFEKPMDRVRSGTDLGD